MKPKTLKAQSENHPEPSSTKELVGAVRDRAQSLQVLLQAIDENLRQDGIASSDECAKDSYGLNGTLEDTINTIDKSRQIAQRLSIYLGVEA